MLETDPDNLRILKYPDPILRKVCQPVEVFDDRIAAIAQRMLELMVEGCGVGLAAPQVGLLIRMFVCNPTGEPGDDMVYINPELDELDGAVDGDEGCLCLPGVLASIRRAESCVIRAKTVTGEPLAESGKGLIARIWQHETDHLDGRLIVDRMSATAKLANRRAIKQLESEFAGRK